MKAGEKERVGALRLVLSELQKDAKEGDGDELAVLRRERKRRREAATAVPRRRPRRARRRRRRRGRADRGLPARPSCPTTSSTRSSRAGDRRDGRRGRRATWARSMKDVMAAAGGRADGKRVSAQGEGGAAARWHDGSSSSPTRSPPSWPAPQDADPAHARGAPRLRRLPARQRASRSTATPRRCRSRRPVVRELSELIAQGHEIAPGTIEAVHARARPARVARARSSRTSSGATATQGRAQDGQPEALRRLDPPQHDHVRRRPGRHRQDVPRRRDGGRRARRAARSTASSSRAPRSRPASGSASCPAT